jgi:hypothetical protein
MRAQMCYHVAVIRRLLSALYVPRSFADNSEVKTKRGMEFHASTSGNRAMMTVRNQTVTVSDTTGGALTSPPTTAR